MLRAGPSDHTKLNVFRGNLAIADRKKAVSYLRTALRLDPENRDAINALGVTLRLLGDPEANKWLELASRRDKLRP